MKKVAGIKSISVNFNMKSANVSFDEQMISAQEVARVISQTPHAMGPKERYGGTLVLSVPDARSHVRKVLSRLADNNDESPF